jgi:hypothetical protein
MVNSIIESTHNNGFEIKAKQKRWQQLKSEHASAALALSILMGYIKKNELSKT